MLTRKLPYSMVLQYVIQNVETVKMELFTKRWNCKKNESAKITLLHGMGGTGSLWRPIAAVLEDEMSLLAPDQRGHGQSIIPHTPGGRTRAKYTPLDYGRDVIETIEKEAFYPTYLVGHSMGVRTATAAAHLKPEWFSGLILIDLGFSGAAGGGLGEDLQSFLKKLPTRFDSRIQAREFMNSECPDPSIAQYLMAVSTISPTGEVTFPFDHAALIETIQAAKDSSVRTWISELAEKNMRILVLRGEKSLVFSKELFEKEKEYFKNAPSIQFLEMKDAGHGLPFEKRTEFAEIVKNFCYQP